MRSFPPFSPLLSAALLSGLLVASAARAAPDCAACAKMSAELVEQNKEIEENTVFLGKNRGYLAALSAKEASKFVKVTGNIELILNRLDAIKDRIKTLKSEMEKEGCDACPNQP